MGHLAAFTKKFLHDLMSGFLDMVRIISIFSLTLFITSCNIVPNRSDIGTIAPASTNTQIAAVTPSPTDRWFSFMMITPYPWSTPLPPYVATSIDGTYAKLDPDEAQWYHCRRCADFLPAGGIWRLQLDKGIYRIYYEVTEWRSLGSFSLSGDRVYFFNDPNCMKDVGEYKWQLTEGALSLELIEDECAIGMRAANFIKQAWLSCQPPDLEAAVSDHWMKPPGCIE
jgi:hypothetical protein